MSNDIALTRPDATLDEQTLRVMMASAQRYVDSGLLPAAIKTPQQALTIMQMGRELGIPATYALRNINVINGKAAASAELLMALVRRTYGQAAIRVAVATNESVTVEYREQGWDGVSSLTFTLEDAKRAKLDMKDTWKAYPRAMLRSRAVSETVRTAFPECIANLYTPEEMGADVTVNEDGGVEIVEVQPVASGGSVSGSSNESQKQEYVCDVCQEPLTATQFKDGTVWEPVHLATQGRRKHGAVLCMTCYREANRVQREAETAAALREQVAF
jgi:hypothetical protein